MPAESNLAAFARRATKEGVQQRAAKKRKNNDSPSGELSTFDLREFSCGDTSDLKVGSDNEFDC